MLGMAGGRGLGQHHRAGEADQLPRHHHVLRAVPPGLEHLVHGGPARDRPPTRSVLFVVTVIGLLLLVLHVYIVVTEQPSREDIFHGNCVYMQYKCILES